LVHSLAGNFGGNLGALWASPVHAKIADDLLSN
jgi:hypothetical protein